MGRLLVSMVNSGINIMATTHSDIIIQHINNMCKFYELGTPCELLEELELEKIDSIDKSNIAIYQFCDLGESSKVKRIGYTEGGFAIPSFQDTFG
jgi:predicted ATPase